MVKVTPITNDEAVDSSNRKFLENENIILNKLNPEFHHKGSLWAILQYTGKLRSVMYTLKEYYPNSCLAKALYGTK